MNGTLPLFPGSAPGSRAHAAPSTQDGGEGETDAARAKRIVALLSGGLATSEEIFEAFAELDALDSKAVMDALRPWTGEASDPESLDDELRRRHGFPPRPPKLRTRSIVRDADVLDLGTLAEEQVRIAGTNWDGRELDAVERLDGEIEDSFAGTLELHTLVDEAAGDDDPARFEVYFFAGDAGAIFKAGTTEIIGAISYGAVEMKDRVLRDAIAAALAAGVTGRVVGKASPIAQSAPPVGDVVAVHGSDDVGEPSTKRVPAKKLAAKVASERRVAATTTAAPKKSTATKKTTAAVATKKAATEKSPAKKAAAVEKAPAKKKAAAAAPAKKAAAAPAKKAASAPAKKVAGEKAPAKKAAAEKTSAKKPASKASTTKASKSAAPKSAAPKSAAPKSAAPKSAAPKSAAPKKAAVEEKAPAKKTAAKKASSKKRAAS